MITEQQRNLEQQLEWMDLKAVQRYASVSERTVREWIHQPINPLPAAQVEKKILIKRSTFDRWLESHPVRSNEIDIDGLVAEVVNEVRRPN
jgi:excisionase family DNA binding protein